MYLQELLTKSFGRCAYLVLSLVAFSPFGNNEGMVVPILAHKDTFDHRQSSYPMCPSFPLENQINQSLTLSFSLAFPPSLPLFLFHSCSYAILKYVLINLQESYLEFEGR